MGFTLQHISNKAIKQRYKVILSHNYYESASSQMLRHQYDTPTFKTNMLRLDSNEGRLKHLLLQYKRLIQPYLSLVWL